MVYYHIGLFIPRALEVRSANKLNGYSFGNDFFQIWLASREWMLQHRDPYSAEMTRDIQTGLYGRPLDSRRPGDPRDQRMFPYPAFTEILLWPAALVSFEAARVVVFCVLALLVVATILLWMRALSWCLDPQWLAILLLLIMCSYPVLEGLYAGQIGLLVSFLLAASMLALQRGKLLLSGALLALTTMKPQVTALAILYLVLWSLYDWRRRGRFCVGLFTIATLLVAAALIVWPHWIASWMSVVIQYHGYTGPPLVREVVTTLLGSAAAGPVTVILTAGLLVISVALAWRNRAVEANSVEFWLTLSVLLAITAIALLPGQAVYDHEILLPGIFLLVLLRKKLSTNWISKGLLLTGAALVIWPWCAALVVILLRPLLTHEQFYSKAVFALPLRSAAAFPFVVLGSLALALRRLQATDHPASIL